MSDRYNKDVQFTSRFMALMYTPFRIFQMGSFIATGFGTLLKYRYVPFCALFYSYFLFKFLTIFYSAPHENWPTCYALQLRHCDLLCVSKLQRCHQRSYLRWRKILDCNSLTRYFMLLSYTFSTSRLTRYTDSVSTHTHKETVVSLIPAINNFRSLFKFS